MFLLILKRELSKPGGMKNDFFKKLRDLRSSRSTSEWIAFFSSKKYLPVEKRLMNGKKNKGEGKWNEPINYFEEFQSLFNFLLQYRRLHCLFPCVLYTFFLVTLHYFGRHPLPHPPKRKTAILFLCFLNRFYLRIQ